MGFITKEFAAFDKNIEAGGKLLRNYIQRSTTLPRTEVISKEMNARQEAKFTMYKAVERHCNDNTGIVEGVIAFQAALTDFRSTIIEIAGTEQLTVSPIEGITIDKSNSKQALAQLTSDIAGFIYAYATVENDQTLKEEANFNYTKLVQTRDDALIPRCQNIHDRALSNLRNLNDYGVSAAKLTDLQAAIDAYAAESPKPRTAVSRRKTHNANLAALFKKADVVLRDRMDKLVGAFRSDHPDFVKTYDSVRLIVDPASTTTQLKGIVTGAKSGLPIKGATITATDAGEPPTGFSKTTRSDAKGKYTLKPLPKGTYKIQITAPGFEDHQEPGVEIKLGDIGHLDVEMELD